MAIVYKYPLKFIKQQVVTIPRDGKIVDIEFQGDDLFMWILHEPTPYNSTEKLGIGIFGTGHVINPNTPNHIKTIHKGEFVWHIFEGWNV